MKRDFISITDLSVAEIFKVFDIAIKIKRELKKKGENTEILKGKTLAMIFEKPSLRTRVSFESGMTQLGGHAVYLSPSDIGMGKRESVHDVAKTLSSMVDIIMARTFLHATVVNLAQYADIPVINGLSDVEHPCQALADYLTILELKGKITGLHIAYIGDCENNVTHSLALAAGLFGAHFSAASPKGYSMMPKITNTAKKLALKTHGWIEETNDPKKAVKNADVVYTDTWISMGDEEEKKKRLEIFPPYQVTANLMKFAKKDAIFMHDLPAYRGNEVTDEVIDGSQSVVFHQAENRLHAQKALICYLLKGHNI